MRPVVFAGPSIYGLTVETTKVDLRPPARQGDILKAVAEGAQLLGLIDGVFGFDAAVWHKEILYALSLDVRVLGASSMGALRAAECASFGMEPVGNIAARYCSGELDDDAAVALTFGPRELGWCPLTVPLVDVDDAVDQMRGAAWITEHEAQAIRESARSLFYADRTLDRVLADAIPDDCRRAAEIETLASRLGPPLKQRDAMLLLEVIEHPPAGPAVERQWKMAEPAFWREMVARTQNRPVTALSRSV